MLTEPIILRTSAPETGVSLLFPTFKVSKIASGSRMGGRRFWRIGVSLWCTRANQKKSVHSARTGRMLLSSLDHTKNGPSPAGGANKPQSHRRGAVNTRSSSASLSGRAISAEGSGSISFGKSAAGISKTFFQPSEIVSQAVFNSSSKRAKYDSFLVRTENRSV